MTETDKRYYLDFPFVGVGVVVWKDDEFLLIRRGKEPMRGAWSIPGGRQNLGETVKEAAIREIREETGLEIVEGLQLPCALSFVWHQDRQGEPLIAEALEALAGVWAVSPT